MGHVSVGEFEAALQDDERVWESFRCLGIPTDDVQSLYEIFDADDNGSLSVEEVLEGCARLGGALTDEWEAMSLHAQVRSLSQLVKRQDDVLGQLERRLTQDVAERKSLEVSLSWLDHLEQLLNDRGDDSDCPLQRTVSEGSI